MTVRNKAGRNPLLPFDQPRTATSSNRVAVDPPLKWAGGRQWLVSHIRSLWMRHAHRRFVEPCCGGLSMTLGLQPEHALLNDINPLLINLFRWLQKGLTLDLPMLNDEATYYEYRKRFNALAWGQGSHTAEAACLFLYLNLTGLNGLYRFNILGEFDVPYGNYAAINYKRDFSDYTSALAGWTFLRGDFENVLLEADDFVFADPPCDAQVSNYAEGGFSWSDQERLVRWLIKHPGPIVLANQASPRIVELYRSAGFRLVYLDPPPRIGFTGDGTPAREVLATRNL